MTFLGIFLLFLSILANTLLCLILSSQRETPKAFRFLSYSFMLQLVYPILCWGQRILHARLFAFSVLSIGFGLLAFWSLFSYKLYYKKAKQETLTVILLSIVGIGLGWSFSVSFLGKSALAQLLTVKTCLFFGMLAPAIALFREFRNKRSLGYGSMGLTFAIGTAIVGLTFLKVSLENIALAGLSLLMTFALVIQMVDHFSRRIIFLENIVAKDKESFKQIIQSAPMPIVVSKLKDDRALLWNEKAGDMFSGANFKENTFRVADFYADPKARKTLLERLEKERSIDNFEVLLKSPESGKEFWVLQSAKLMDYANDIAVYSSFQNITGRKIKEIELFDQATKDPLTGAYNRRQFEEVANKEFAKTLRTKRPLCLLMLDADHFKKINDTYSHHVGDMVLKELAQICQKTIRKSDTLARFGGEEFVILLPETSIERARQVAEKLRTKISQSKVQTDGGKEISFTVSIGVAEATGKKSIEETLKKADEALYVAKENGRNQVVTDGAPPPPVLLP